jgi:hypothetical protein
MPYHDVWENMNAIQALSQLSYGPTGRPRAADPKLCARWCEIKWRTGGARPAGQRRGEVAGDSA